MSEVIYKVRLWEQRSTVGQKSHTLLLRKVGHKQERTAVVYSSLRLLQNQKSMGSYAPLPDVYAVLQRPYAINLQ
jgi:hypothetical protein